VPRSGAGSSGRPSLLGAVCHDVYPAWCGGADCQV